MHFNVLIECAKSQDDANAQIIMKMLYRIKHTSYLFYSDDNIYRLY